MIVFKTILKILNKLKGLIILYTIMLISVTSINQVSNNAQSFEEVKPSIIVVNHNQDMVSDNFIKFLDEHFKIKDIDVSNEEKIDDALFYRDVSLVIYVRDNFNKVLSDEDININYKSSGDEYSSYGKMIIDSYFNTLSIYKDKYSGEELFNKVNSVLNKNINVVVDSKIDTNNLSRMTRFFNFLNYAILAGCVYSISMILASVKEEKIRKRTVISSFDMKKYNRILLLSCFLVIFGMWLLYMLLAFIMFKDLMVSYNGLLYIINSFVFSVCALSLGFLIGTITQNKNAISGIINVVGVGSSFLCGCFVPMEYMPLYVLKIAHALPTYYFVINNENIKLIENFSYSNLGSLVINMGVVLLFGIGFIVITNYINKKKQVLD